MSKVHIEMFSEAKIALIKEVQDNWEPIVKALIEAECQDWPEQLGVIAAFCGVALDGYYTPAQLEDLTDKLVWKLRAARRGIATGRPIGTPLKDIPYSVAKDNTITKH